MANTYVQIGSTVTVGSGGAANIEFTSIPATFTDLCVKISARTDVNGFRDLLISFNSNTASFTNKSLEGNGSAASSQSTARYLGTVGGTNLTSSTFINSEAYITNYAGSANKSFSADTVGETNATTIYSTLSANLWSNSAAITAIGIAPSSGNFVQYSTATLYGIKKN
jgi:hypothetical protein